MNQNEKRVKAGLTATLAGPGCFTLFAPDDDAWRAAGAGLSELGPSGLARVIRFHIVPCDSPVRNRTRND